MSEKQQLYVQCEECMGIGDTVVVDDRAEDGFTLQVCPVCQGKGFRAIEGLFYENQQKKTGDAA